MPRLVCHAHSSPAPKYEWHFKPLVVSEHDNHRSIDQEQLVSRNAQLDLRHLTLELHASVSSAPNELGSDTPTSIYSTTATSTSLLALAASEEENHLNAAAVHRLHSGTYRCEASNALGVASSAPLTLVVQHKPTCRTVELLTSSPSVFEFGGAGEQQWQHAIRASYEAFLAMPISSSTNMAMFEAEEGSAAAATTNYGATNDATTSKWQRTGDDENNNSNSILTTATASGASGVTNEAPHKLTFACAASAAVPHAPLTFVWRLMLNNTNNSNESTQSNVTTPVTWVLNTGHVHWLPSSSSSSPFEHTMRSGDSTNAVSVRVLRRADYELVSFVTLELRRHTTRAARASATDNSSTHSWRQQQQRWTSVDDHNEIPTTDADVNSNSNSNNNEAAWLEHALKHLSCTAANSVGVSDACSLRLALHSQQQLSKPSQATWPMPILATNQLIAACLMCIVVVLVALTRWIRHIPAGTWKAACHYPSSSARSSSVFGDACGPPELTSNTRHHSGYDQLPAVSLLMATKLGSDHHHHHHTDNSDNFNAQRQNNNSNNKFNNIETSKSLLSLSLSASSCAANSGQVAAPTSGSTIDQFMRQQHQQQQHEQQQRDDGMCREDLSNGAGKQTGESSVTTSGSPSTAASTQNLLARVVKKNCDILRSVVGGATGAFVGRHHQQQQQQQQQQQSQQSSSISGDGRTQHEHATISSSTSPSSSMASSSDRSHALGGCTSHRHHRHQQQQQQQQHQRQQSNTSRSSQLSSSGRQFSTLMVPWTHYLDEHVLPRSLHEHEVANNNQNQLNYDELNERMSSLPVSSHTYSNTSTSTNTNTNTNINVHTNAISSNANNVNNVNSPIKKICANNNNSIPTIPFQRSVNYSSSGSSSTAGVQSIVGPPMLSAHQRHLSTMASASQSISIANRSMQVQYDALDGLLPINIGELTSSTDNGQQQQQFRRTQSARLYNKPIEYLDHSIASPRAPPMATTPLNRLIADGNIWPSIYEHPSDNNIRQQQRHHQRQQQQQQQQPRPTPRSTFHVQHSMTTTTNGRVNGANNNTNQLHHWSSAAAAAAAAAATTTTETATALNNGVLRSNDYTTSNSSSIAVSAASASASVTATAGASLQLNSADVALQYLAYNNNSRPLRQRTWSSVAPFAADEHEYAMLPPSQYQSCSEQQYRQQLERETTSSYHKYLQQPERQEYSLTANAADEHIYAKHANETPDSTPEHVARGYNVASSYTNVAPRWSNNNNNNNNNSHDYNSPIHSNNNNNTNSDCETPATMDHTPSIANSRVGQLISAFDPAQYQARRQQQQRKLNSINGNARDRLQLHSNHNGAFI
ncbi:hypothetical protein GZH46_01808, partial [Fragariocoptes setiger]